MLKGEYSTCVAAGFPVEYVGPSIGVRNDGRLHMENAKRRAMIKDWEFWLGDKAYVGCPEFLSS